MIKGKTHLKLISIAAGQTDQFTFIVGKNCFFHFCVASSTDAPFNIGTPIKNTAQRWLSNNLSRKQQHQQQANLKPLQGQRKPDPEQLWSTRQ
jgi:hypothetical protein